MQTRMWSPPADSREMGFTLRASSEGRNWTGFEAATYDVTYGVADRPPRTNYVITMHMGSPVRGTCRCDGPARRRLQVAGDMDVIPFGYAAAWEDYSCASVLNVRITPALMRSVGESMQVNPDAMHFAPQLQLRDPRLQHICWSLVADLEDANPSGRLFADSLGTAIAAHLLSRCSGAQEIVPVRGLSRRQLKYVVDYINENLSADLLLAELAMVAGVSSSHFKVLFKQSFGIAVHQYVIKRRVDYAVSLLSGGNARLSDIAQQSGFADQSHMARCMRRLIGTTPAAIVRECR